MKITKETKSHDVYEIAQALHDSRGDDVKDMLGYMPTLAEMEAATELYAADPVQYIQYDNHGSFYSYTPEEWFTYSLLPNMQCTSVVGRVISRAEWFNYLKNNTPVEGVVFPTYP